MLQAASTPRSPSTTWARLFYCGYSISTHAYIEPDLAVEIKAAGLWLFYFIFFPMVASISAPKNSRTLLDYHTVHLYEWLISKPVRFCFALLSAWYMWKNLKISFLSTCLSEPHLVQSLSCTFVKWDVNAAILTAWFIHEWAKREREECKWAALALPLARAQPQTSPSHWRN